MERKIRGLFLYGANCTKDIWLPMKDLLVDIVVDYVEYPHEMLKCAKNVNDITKWVFSQYGEEHYDFIAGHSMGGIIALDLASEYEMDCNKVIIIESNLKPANMFYRNLLMPNHLNSYGDKVIEMIKSESVYYEDSLKKLLQEDFDYTNLVSNIKQPIYAIYGDRGQPLASNRISDLCLDQKTLDKLTISFVEDSCHMPMIENPSGLVKAITNIVI